jgi:LmbE family N-acetylglucosaminyl deacetylase
MVSARAKRGPARARFLAGAKSAEVVIKTFRNSYFPFVAEEIKEYVETLKHEVSPDVIFTHYHEDYHQDHRLISQLTWNAFRSHQILEYEVPKRRRSRTTQYLLSPR